mmetsp:Transcript_6334/g.15698  ORF Transcript_6334/g.15698 Transcript_6334/m.15698 type:complete len:111 (-) Transcript_6334:13-345(-)
MTFVELPSADALTEFMNANAEDGCVVTFSAIWCGPCKACKPRLRDEIARKSKVPIGYVYESDLDQEFLDVFVGITAFPTFVFFRNGQEAARVEGARLESVQGMIIRETST